MIIPTKKTKRFSNQIAEFFRTLRTNIEFVSIHREVKTVVFTSASRSEGKSTTVANYGVTLAVQGQKTLIIDCDLRNPTQHEIFNIKNDYGLTEILLARVKVEEATYETKINNLSIITSGLIPPNPADILNSEKMNQLIEHFKNKYDVIIFDTCPLSVASDPSILAAKADATVLVVRAKQSEKESVKRTIKALQLAQANLLGVVLNGIEQEFINDNYYGM